MPEVVCISSADYNADVCRAIEAYAGRWRLPAGYFARLIWQESRFDPQALSSAGAQGIAQFMPGTARIRKLNNSFDPAEALARSAEYLRFLSDRFGNLGLAAAAYNGGEGMAQRLTTLGGGVAAETRDYVRIITGHAVEDWMATPLPEVDYALKPGEPFVDACIEMAKNTPVRRLETESTGFKPWGVLVAQDFSASTARRLFERVKKQHASILGGEELMLLSGRNPAFGRRTRHFAMIGRETRKAAQELCAKLTLAGGSCVVRKN